MKLSPPRVVSVSAVAGREDCLAVIWDLHYSEIHDASSALYELQYRARGEKLWKQVSPTTVCRLEIITGDAEQNKTLGFKQLGSTARFHSLLQVAPHTYCNKLNLSEIEKQAFLGHFFRAFLKTVERDVSEHVLLSNQYSIHSMESVATVTCFARCLRESLCLCLMQTLIDVREASPVPVRLCDLPAFTEYTFRLRSRYKSDMSHWSEWSNKGEARTPERGERGS